MDRIRAVRMQPRRQPTGCVTAWRKLRKAMSDPPQM
jgi:hypothetical protein